MRFGRIALAVVLGLVAASAHAQLYTATDAGVGPAGPFPNSNTEAAVFDSAASLIGPETIVNFESSPLGSFSSLTIAPGLTVTGSDFNNANQSIQNAPLGPPPSDYGFNTTPGGSKYLQELGGIVTFKFTTPVEYFGAYITGAQVVADDINTSGGSFATAPIPFNANGGVDFVGLILGNPFNTVSITVNNDVIGVDDIRFGTFAPASGVPEPSGFALLSIAGLMGVGALRRRRWASRLCSLFICLVILNIIPISKCAGKTVTIGNGSGELEYPTAQQSLNLRPGDTVYINSGVYSGMRLSAISGTKAAPIMIKADPKAVFTTTVSHSNEVSDLAFVVFDGLHYQDYNGNAMKIGGASHDVTFKNMSMIHGGTFNVYDGKRVFDGGKASAFYNFRWLNCSFDAAGIISEDWSPLSNLISVDLDFEVSHCTFKNYDCSKGPATIIDIGKAFNLQVHDCQFSDLGICESPIGHDVCIVYRGYAKVYNNRFTREWGDDVRCFPIKLNALGYNGTGAVNRFYNNIAFEKRKYAMFEHNMMIPQAELDKSKGYFSRTSSEVCFNTLYRSRKVDYCAPLVDIYAPNITIRYNLIIEPECDVPWNPQYDLAPDAPTNLRSNYVYHVGTELGPQPGVVVDHNLVYRSLTDSGLVDVKTFMPSASSGAFSTPEMVDYIKDDFYHRPRYKGAIAYAGAVQRQ